MNAYHPSISPRRGLAVLAMMFCLLPIPALAALKIDITQGNVEPLPIAVLDFDGEGSVGQDLATVIVADLERSGLFRPVDRDAFIERNIGVNVRPRFSDWRVINALALVTGRAVQHSDGRLLVEFRLWDVVAEEQMAGLQFFTTPENAFGGRCDL